ncbi:MAG: alpha/beta hydrolase [Muribaculaceae bacterium]|nr:alpha/beta hydrolase [Muribaculaceae bacterium]
MQFLNERYEYDGGILCYEIAGEGNPLLLMHGWGCDRSTVRSIAETAVKNGYRVFNIDFPGFGESTEPSEVWGVDEYTSLIEQFIKDKDLKDITLIGHSFGGRVGILYSSRNKVRKLVLVDAAGIKPKRKLKYYYKVYSFKALKRLYKLLYGKEKAEIKADELRKKRGSSDYANSSPMMQRILSRVVNEDLKNELKKIKTPTLLMWGTNDKATPIDDARIMEKLIPDAGLVSFEGCGHYSFLDARPHFNIVLSKFLSH